MWARVPEDTDVFVTHGPPLGYLDGGLGWRELLRTLWRAKPLAHVFGHFHQGHGSLVLRFNGAQRDCESIVTRIWEERKTERTG